MRSATFAFPSNVLARALELEEGRLDHLHVGLAQSTDEPLWQAQERATQRLLSVLREPVAHRKVKLSRGVLGMLRSQQL